MSFFTKLKKEVGIEEENKEEENPAEPQELKKKSSPKAKMTKKMGVREPKVLEPMAGLSDGGLKGLSTENPSTNQKSLEKSKKEWPEKTGELAIDLYQSPDFLVIQSAVAGLKPEELDIALDNDMLIISGERQKPNQNEEKEIPVKYLHQECYWGPFSRKIVLPEEIDIAKIEATMKQGILTIRLPRVHKQKIKKIAVREE